MTHVIQQTF